MDFLEDHPVVPFLVAHVVIQIVIHNVLKGVKLAKHFENPNSRLILTQRVARVILGMTFGVRCLILLFTEQDCYEHVWTGQSALAEWWLWAMIGYLIADMSSIFYGYFAVGTALQPDLLVHHVSGCWWILNLYYNYGDTTKGIFLSTGTLVSELLTVFTGTTFFLSALPPTKTITAARRAVSKFRLGGLMFMRFPLWMYLLTRSFLAWGNDMPTSGFIIVLVGESIVLSLDVYWIQMLWRAGKKKSASLT